MSDLTLKSPRAAADELRSAADELAHTGDKYALVCSADDCRYLATFLDDLSEAIGLLRSVFQAPGWSERAKGLLAKYEEASDEH